MARQRGREPIVCHNGLLSAGGIGDEVGTECEVVQVDVAVSSVMSFFPCPVIPPSVVRSERRLS